MMSWNSKLGWKIFLPNVNSVNCKYLTQMVVKVLASSVDLCIIHRLLTDLFDNHYNSHSDLSTNVISFYCKLTRLCYFHPVSHLVDIPCPVLCYILYWWKRCHNNTFVILAVSTNPGFTAYGHY